MFRTYKHAYRGEEIVSKMIDNKISESRVEAENLLQKMQDAHLVFNAASSKEACKDKHKSIVSLTLKGKIILFDDAFLMKSLDHLDATYEDQDVTQEDLLAFTHHQFQIINVYKLSQESSCGPETYGLLLQRMAFVPDVFLSEFSDHLNIQNNTGLSMDLKDRIIRLRNLKNTFCGFEAVEWLLDNTDIETREQGSLLMTVLLKRNLIFPVNKEEDKFLDSKDCIYMFPAIAMKTILAKPNEQIDEKIETSEEDSAAQAALIANSKNIVLQNIIDNAETCKVFKDFLATMYCTENLDFYLITKRYAELFDSNGVTDKNEEVSSLAKEIWSTFLENKELNVEDSLWKLVQKQYAEAHIWHDGNRFFG
ncbi:hypothetical protein ROZALSC1DRAFT_29355 [Rozella allomycis CSF55]|nr:hypothetical protein ROZALSC1DRAFT_29355 [Rozella allomycis CSF55]